eukprot:m51a1_g7277 hypothetical protein (215) ;mRNA; f:2984-4849
MEETSTEQSLRFRFPHCQSNCNSSRMHLGGRVVIAFDIRCSGGSLVARALSPPLVLQSSSGLLCGGKAMKPVISIEGHMEQTSTDKGQLFRFSYCFSNCNSSRMHLGGMVVIAFDIRCSDGSLAARALSAPLSLQSQSGIRTKHRSRPKDCSPVKNSEDSAGCVAAIGPEVKQEELAGQAVFTDQVLLGQLQAMLREQNQRIIALQMLLKLAAT